MKRTRKGSVFVGLIMFLISSDTISVIGGECVCSLFIPSLNDSLLVKHERITQELEGLEDLFPDTNRKKLIVTIYDDQIDIEQLIAIFKRNGRVAQSVRLLQEPHGDVV